LGDVVGSGVGGVALDERRLLRWISVNFFFFYFIFFINWVVDWICVVVTGWVFRHWIVAK
jgi:hypothetical protein